MKLRFEVAQRKTWSWPYFLKEARKCAAYRIEGKRTKAPTHVVEYDSLESALKTWNVIQGWKAIWVYVNDRAWTPLMFKMQVWKYQRAPLAAKQMLNEVIENAARKRARGDDEGRWRMGLGPQ